MRKSRKKKEPTFDLIEEYDLSPTEIDRLNELKDFLQLKDKILDRIAKVSEWRGGDYTVSVNWNKETINGLDLFFYLKEHYQIYNQYDEERKKYQQDPAVQRKIDEEEEKRSEEYWETDEAKQEVEDFCHIVEISVKNNNKNG